MSCSVFSPEWISARSSAFCACGSCSFASAVRSAGRAEASPISDSAHAHCDAHVVVGRAQPVDQPLRRRGEVELTQRPRRRRTHAHALVARHRLAEHRRRRLGLEFAQRPRGRSRAPCHWRRSRRRPRAPSPRSCRRSHPAPRRSSRAPGHPCRPARLWDSALTACSEPSWPRAHATVSRTEGSASSRRILSSAGTALSESIWPRAPAAACRTTA